MSIQNSSIIAGKYLKPYQGLKLGFATDLDFEISHYSAGKYLKPYQGLKRFAFSFLSDWCRWAGKYLKPYQGLKLRADKLLRHLQGRKIPKTLSGIETCQYRETIRTDLNRRNIPKTLSGIETYEGNGKSKPYWYCRKIPKTLSGIETHKLR